MTSDNAPKFFQLQALVESKSSGRAALQNWMVEEYPRFQAMFGDNRIDWIGLTAALNEMGFRNSKGDDLSVESVRQTWIRATRRREVMVARKKRLEALPTDRAPVRAGLFRPAPAAAPAPRSVVVHDPVVSVPVPVENTPEPDADEDDGGLARMKAEMAWRSGRGKKPD